ncbi:MAG: threonine synthase [Bauldia sp.]|nr:threonine synthase [Bauldia sp.]
MRVPLADEAGDDADDLAGGRGCDGDRLGGDVEIAAIARRAEIGRHLVGLLRDHRAVDEDRHLELRAAGARAARAGGDAAADADGEGDRGSLGAALPRGVEDRRLVADIAGVFGAGEEDHRFRARDDLDLGAGADRDQDLGLAGREATTAAGAGGEGKRRRPRHRNPDRSSKAHHGLPPLTNAGVASIAPRRGGATGGRQGCPGADVWLGCRAAAAGHRSARRFSPLDYYSTRGEAPVRGFRDVLLAGLAEDGGLYLPAIWPKITPDEIEGFAGRPYHEVVADLVGRFAGGEIADEALRAMCREAYAGFNHPAVTPLVELAPNRWVLELFRGPTLAFKDLAMQLLARLMDHVLAERDGRATIVAATSGDTGSAAIEAFRGRERIDVFVLFPSGRVSPVQQRQMTTVLDPNIHTLAVEGSFDDCQSLVKALFARERFRKDVSLAAVNSINWGRIVAQTAYYFSSAAAIGGADRPVDYAVPTGNFGDAFAGYVARCMGLPIAHLVIATNSNDILARAFADGRYEVRGIVPTSSPSMDIGISSNFERLLFEVHNGDAPAVRRMMAGLAQSGSFSIGAGPLEEMRRLFAAGRADEAETVRTIRETYEATGYLVDTHTAVGLAVASRYARPEVPMITLSTAHPAKFPDAVEAASGVRPGLPPALADLMDREERFTTIAPDADAVEDFIRAHARAVTIEV